MEKWNEIYYGSVYKMHGFITSDDGYSFYTSLLVNNLLKLDLI